MRCKSKRCTVEHGGCDASDTRSCGVCLEEWRIVRSWSCVGGAPEDASQKPRARAAGAAGATTVVAPRTAGAGVGGGPTPVPAWPWVWRTATTACVRTPMCSAYK